MQNEAEKPLAPGTPAVPEKGNSLLTFDLPALVAQLKGEESWQKNGRGARTLYKTESMRIVLNVMQAGTDIKPHQALGPISVQVVEGQIRFSTDQESVMLEKGELLTLHEHVRHSVEALKESAFLLTVAPITSKR